jgi:hypothetical protein
MGGRSHYQLTICADFETFTSIIYQTESVFFIRLTFENMGQSNSSLIAKAVVAQDEEVLRQVSCELSLQVALISLAPV